MKQDREKSILSILDPYMDWDLNYIREIKIRGACLDIELEVALLTFHACFNPLKTTANQGHWAIVTLRFPNLLSLKSHNLELDIDFDNEMNCEIGQIFDLVRVEPEYKLIGSFNELLIHSDEPKLIVNSY